MFAQDILCQPVNELIYKTTKKAATTFSKWCRTGHNLRTM